ncbi:MAG TPA: hypothetical protein HA263_07940 [Methanoregulaceae archaeon]|nr:hypothetical protein [Methanoregulaceae archaeon]
MNFTTIADVGTWFDNSGLVDWEWFEGFNKNDLIEYIWRRFDSREDDDDGNEMFWKGDEPTPVDEVLAAYLREHGENPADYSL